MSNFLLLLELQSLYKTWSDGVSCCKYHGADEVSVARRHPGLYVLQQHALMKESGAEGREKSRRSVAVYFPVNRRIDLLLLERTTNDCLC